MLFFLSFVFFKLMLMNDAKFKIINKGLRGNQLKSDEEKIYKKFKTYMACLFALMFLYFLLEQINYI